MNRITTILFAFLATFSSLSFGQTDKKLTRLLTDATKDFHGTLGIYVHNLKTNKTVALNADTLFPTASMIKVSILAGVMDKIEKGELKYNQKLGYRDSLLYAGDDILGSFKDKDSITLSRVAMLMITMSDNTASLWLQKLVTGAYINQWLENNGFKYMRVNSRVEGRQQFQRKYGWGVTTPYEMCRLFTMIRNGEAVNPAASERMYRNLIRIYWDDKSLAQIPPYVQVASKSGAVDASRSETVLVNAPHGDYVFSIITKNNLDKSWTTQNEASQMIRKVSALLWHYYEPKSKWKSPEGIDKFMTNE